MHSVNSHRHLQCWLLILSEVHFHFANDATWTEDCTSPKGKTFLSFRLKWMSRETARGFFEATFWEERTGHWQCRAIQCDTVLGWNTGWAPCDDSTLTQRIITSILAAVERMILFLYFTTEIFRRWKLLLVYYFAYTEKNSLQLFYWWSCFRLFYVANKNFSWLRNPRG